MLVLSIFHAIQLKAMIKILVNTGTLAYATMGSDWYFMYSIYGTNAKPCILIQD